MTDPIRECLKFSQKEIGSEILHKGNEMHELMQKSQCINSKDNTEEVRNLEMLSPKDNGEGNVTQVDTNSMGSRKSSNKNPLRGDLHNSAPHPKPAKKASVKKRKIKSLEKRHITDPSIQSAKAPLKDSDVVLNRSLGNASFMISEGQSVKDKGNGLEVSRFREEEDISIKAVVENIDKNVMSMLSMAESKRNSKEADLPFKGKNIGKDEPKNVGEKQLELAEIKSNELNKALKESKDVSWVSTAMASWVIKMKLLQMIAFRV